MSTSSRTTTTMGRSLSPSLLRELENLDKDADRRKSAMKTLKLYVKDLDSNTIPLFLARVSQTKDTGSSHGEFTISLYEALARVHGPKIAPQIDNIMATIINTLTSSACSFALHQACSKVVPAIARYGIDPTMAKDTKRSIIHSLCKPLSDSLLVSNESLSSGSALCLKALVECDNWRFAWNDLVNEVCQRVAAALEKQTQPNSHMDLIKALAKHNSLIVEAYARLLIHSGLRMLNVGISEGSSQKRLSAIQMVNFLMRCLEPKSLFSELRLIKEEMENCQSDQYAYVRGAAFECLQTARRITMEKGLKFDKEMSVSTTGSNYAASPESQTVSSFVGHDTLMESPISVNSFSGEYNHDRRSVNRKLRKRYENGKDGLYSEVPHGESGVQSDQMHNSGSDYASGFAGFFQGSPLRSTTRSPQKSGSQINVDNNKSFTTPRMIIRSQSCNECGCTPTLKFDQDCYSPNLSNGRELDMYNDKFLGDSSESVSSTEDIIASEGLSATTQIASKFESSRNSKLSSNFKPFIRSMTCGFVAILMAVFVYLLRISDQREGSNLVPT